MKRIRNTEITMLRINGNTKTEIERMIETTEIGMKMIGNREKEDGDDKEHKDRSDENCRKHGQKDDYNNKKRRDWDVEDDKKNKDRDVEDEKKLKDKYDN